MEIPDATPDAPTANPPDKQLIAPLWHLVCVFLLLAGWVSLSLFPRQHHFGALSPRISSYLAVLFCEWFIFAFIWWGLRIQRVPFASLFGEISARLRKVLVDIGIAVVFLIVANIVLNILGVLLRTARDNQGVKRLLPHTPAEIAVYLLVCITAGICEETIFRGYLQRQFTALTKSAAVGAILQGIIFGLAHAYQGWKMIIIIAIYGCIFGALVLWRRSLRPGMIAHFLQDSIAGIFLARHL
ncbi:MAG TPA: type II CAAX endopeptidase family protein [Candidatus Aquilonibacter sp.]|nr:type II CAAX endopeptidase family protein [Candidatus Aquilonibacter sp.]